MIKINNINFTQKTIESIQIDGTDIKEINFKFHEREFKLRIIKDNHEIIEEVIEEQPKEEVIEETPEEVIQGTKKLSIGEVKKIIYDTIPKANTADTYFRTLKQVYDNFKEDDIYELLKKENEIIEYIEKQYEKLSTIKNKLCGIYKVYSLLNIESIVLKSKIEQYKVSLTIQEDKEKENPIDKKTIEEAEKIVNYFKNEMETMGEKVKNDIDILNRWDTTAQLYAVLKIYLTYGMIRPSEIINMKITDTDEGNAKINYINVVSKKIVINNHKNDRKGPKIIDITDNKLNGILCKGLKKISHN